MKMNYKISAYILRSSAAALLFSCALVALCSAINLTGQSLKAVPSQDKTVFAGDAQKNRSLIFADRVAYQRAIEDVYWRHRIWPRGGGERPDPKPALDAVMSQAQIEKKVTDYLRNSQALEDDWQRPITAEQLQSEMKRMASHTKQPGVLRELFAALGNDPFVIAECLAKPALVERLVAQLQAQDEKPSTVAWLNQPLRSWLAKAATQAPVTMAAMSSASYALPVIAGPSSGCSDDTWTATTLTNAPEARARHTAVWTGTEMIVWGGDADFSTYFNTGGRYNPSTDSWTATSTTNAPSARSYHTAVWTGSEMIVWGGSAPGGVFNTGGRYNPSTDSWTATTRTNAPSARAQHTAVLTDSEMIVWGGNDSGGSTNTGGRYNPITNSWTTTSTASAPAARAGHTAVWIGSEMIVWGGYNGTFLNTGGRYNPSTDSWTATTLTNAPSARTDHRAVWTDTEMIVWGGDNGTGDLFNTGGRYNPSTDSWTPTSLTNAPNARGSHTAVWTGSDMIVWGGCGSDPCNSQLFSGGRYNASADSWTATTLTNAPEARTQHTAVWTGSEMIVWGGVSQSGPWNTGGRYCAQSGPPITLSAVGRKVGGINTVRLTWSGASSTNVDVYRNGVVIVTVANTGRYTDSTGDTGRARYTYKVCEAGTMTCANEVTVTFQR
jgi:N-acetylneuraminic acid mutarotase